MSVDRRPLGVAFTISCAVHVLLFVAARGSSVELHVLEPGPVLVSLYEVGRETAGPGPLGPELGVDPLTSSLPPSPSLSADPLGLQALDDGAETPTRTLLAAEVSNAAVPPPAIPAREKAAPPAPSAPSPQARDDEREPNATLTAHERSASPQSPADRAQGASVAESEHASGAADARVAAAVPESGGERQGPIGGAPGGTGASAPRWAPTVRIRYEQELFAWLTRFKQYPALARRRGIEGLSVVRVRIDRSGRVLARSVHETAGERALDEAALDMVRRADPFPPIPAAYPDTAFEFLAPIEFRLQEARSR